MNSDLLSALQWGRNLFVAESHADELDHDIEEILQWGRNLFVAESESWGGGAQWGAPAFNGAATCSLRKATHGRY